MLVCVFFAVVFKSSYLVVSSGVRLVGNTSERNFNSLQFGLKKSLKVNEAYPLLNTISGSEVYSSES